jgi:replicative superfamily II helicase/predicted  nucleic acid-binding Zn-ribbon protein
MTLHPIRVLDHVIDEYRDYLLTEFRAKDARLKEALERELDRPGFLAQEPFFQAHRPFKDGERWRDLSIDPRLAKTMEERSKSERCYVHQSETIIHLLSPQASPVVVTTGTGSGKTECFLLPVIQNAFEDATRFKRFGLTAILLYPMNALANDQFQRIEDYLEASGLTGVINVAKYDRGTKQAQREALRSNPPHILLTNYMMLEYLLVRPADREAIFANHRCRFLVLDEVHTYRGILGSNVALLVRRLKAHLARARQDWHTDVAEADWERRYPKLITIGTSATIRSLDEEGLSREEARRARDAAVQDFFSRLTGDRADRIKVLGEELRDIQIPAEAQYGADGSEDQGLHLSNPDSVRRALCRLADIDEAAPLEEAGRRCRILWDLNALLIRKPMSISQLVASLRDEASARRDWPEEQVRREIELALNLGAALPEGTPGSLQLRVHRFIRGGWHFHRCIDPACGKLYPMGEEECECGHRTAPLYLCRDCGADYLRFVGDEEASELEPSAVRTEGLEWMLYEPDRFDIAAGADEEEVESEEEDVALPRAAARRLPKRIRKRPVLHGSFDVNSLSFSADENDYPLKVILSPARTQCLCCGGTAGSRNVITPVALGTSAAVKVLGEGLLDALATEDREKGDADHKDRLLVFSDSRQDAAHQARFIIFASRYDRMRRRVVQLLDKEGPLSIQRVVELLGELGVQRRDNPHASLQESAWIPTDQLKRIRAWEEAPLLDDLAVNAGYRATLVNLGLVCVAYDRLDEYVEAGSGDLSNRLGLDEGKLTYLCARLLDDIRTRGCLSCEMLRYSPYSPRCPDYVRAAEWERRVSAPQGYSADDSGKPVPYLDPNTVPPGITAHNAWRKPKAGGRAPRLQHTFEHLLAGLGGVEPHEELLVEVLEFLLDGSFLRAVDLYGAREKRQLIQVNAESIRLELTSEGARNRCQVCGVVIAPARSGLPCPRCHGRLAPFTNIEVNESRYVRRIRASALASLFAGEHTAQVPHDERLELEEQFKGTSDRGRINVLACSPTLEMGIDVGGLDAIVMRNVPPRPDNYAQRGGRAGRRSRVGLVVGYARSTPHDQYFYDKPDEMIAGEVPVPSFALGNRDVIWRHLNAIVFGASDPGVAGKMVDYVGPMGDIKEDNANSFIDGVRNAYGEAIALALEAWGDDVFEEAGLDRQELATELQRLPERIMHVIERTARQVQELRRALETYYRDLRDPRAGQRAGELVARLLGIASHRRQEREEADDRSAGYPLRRFAEFGILPGYEFASEPAALRLAGDVHEEDPITTTRRFGIGQFQPDAQVFARTRRWRVAGLDPASPWNPLGDTAGWLYRLCRGCQLRFDANEPRCPRCSADVPGQPLVGMEYAGFVGRRDERPVLDEEERYAVRNLVSIYPQWDGDVIARWSVGSGWGLRLSRGETVMWINEGLTPTSRELDSGVPRLHQAAKGYLLCGSCGRILEPAQSEDNARGGRRQARRAGASVDPFGHAPHCPRAGTAPQPVAIVTGGRGEILRLLAAVPEHLSESQLSAWGLSLGYALRMGMIRHFALSDGDIDFELEGAWVTKSGEVSFRQGSLAFIDPNLGGSGYLPRIAERFDDVAIAALEHLQHDNCETACYRCLKAYENQRYHEYLSWPGITGDLEGLAAQPPQPRPSQTGDIDDPRPWLEAYAEGVGSPLELKFLRLFQRHRLSVEKQVPVAPSEEEAAISVADFAIPGARVAIYVDGAAFHVGQNLRRDIFIRNRLRSGSPPWKVEELRAADLAQGKSLVERIKAFASGA